jgi:hypothetical protein
MKSFADWTDEIAQSVGEVTHHWETRKEAELKEEFSHTTYGYDIAVDGDQPEWPAGSAPQAPAPSVQCNYCNGYGIMGYSIFTYMSVGGLISLCDGCARILGHKH